MMHLVEEVLFSGDCKLKTDRMSTMSAEMSTEIPRNCNGTCFNLVEISAVKIRNYSVKSHKSKILNCCGVVLQANSMFSKPDEGAEADLDK